MFGIQHPWGFYWLCDIPPKSMSQAKAKSKDESEEWFIQSDFKQKFTRLLPLLSLHPRASTNLKPYDPGLGTEEAHQGSTINWLSFVQLFPLLCSFLSPLAFYKHLNILTNTEEFGLSKKISSFIKILRIVGPSLSNVQYQSAGKCLG